MSGGPSSSSTAGRSRLRTTNGVEEDGDREAEAEQLDRALRPSTNERKTHTMIVAAAVITRPVVATPSTTAREASRRLHPLLVDARDEEHLVVHREAEDDREQDHRHARRRSGPCRRRRGRRASRTGRRRPSHPSAAPIESRFMTAACTGITSERKTTSSSNAASADDDGDEQRQLAREHVREVDAARGGPPTSMVVPVPAPPAEGPCRAALLTRSLRGGRLRGGAREAW